VSLSISDDGSERESHGSSNALLLCSQLEFLLELQQLYSLLLRALLQFFDLVLSPRDFFANELKTSVNGSSRLRLILFQ